MNTHGYLTECGTDSACVKLEGNRSSSDSITDRRLLTNEISEERRGSLLSGVLRPPRSSGTGDKDTVNTRDYGINSTALLLSQSECKRKHI